MANLRAFIRIDGSGKLMANSFVIQKNVPKYGAWQEVPMYDRFLTVNVEDTAPVYENTSYGVSVLDGETATFVYDDPETGITAAPVTLVGPLSQLVNAKTDTIVPTEGPITVCVLGEYVV